ncbi:hypothetical protein K2Y11_01865 [bacterium]|nr:hypothetical protein [bacterium]
MASERLWILRNGQPRLQGAHCGDCGAVSFPARHGCIVCGSAVQTIVDLSNRGKIESRTQVGERIVCEIRMESGPRVMGWLESGELVDIGSSVEFAPHENELRFVPDV